MVPVSASKPKTIRTVSVSMRENAVTLRDAFARYVATNKLPQEILADSPMETWDRIQVELSKHKEKRGFLSRLFFS